MVSASTSSSSSETAPGAYNPADLTPLDAVPTSSADAVRAAVAAARAAQPAWAALPLAERSARAIAFGRRLLERRQELARVLAQETGRSETECILSELGTQVSYAKAAVRVAKSALTPERVKLSPIEFPGKNVVVEAVPRGVIGIIAPWNYPAGNFFKSLYPALLSGNAVVLKPSEHTPRSGALVADVCREILPDGLVQLVQGGGSVGAALLDAGVDGIVFTGSVATGRRVAVAAAERLIPCSVELGGKDAAIVLADCDLDRTALGIATWGMHNCGQNCAGIERVYVEEKIADAFVQKLTKVTSALRVAPAPVSDLGPLQNPMQLAIVEDHVKDAVAKGAKVACGGARTGKGYGYAPTVLDACTHAMKVVTDETFGPVLAVVRVKDAEEAISLANDSRYGLNGSVWTKDVKRGAELARRLDVGVALVNNHAFSGVLAETPWTGTKETGTGVAASRHSYPTFVRRRAVIVDTGKDPEPFWLPFDENVPPFVEALAQMQLGSMGAVLSLLGLIKKRVKALKAVVAG